MDLRKILISIDHMQHDKTLALQHFSAIADSLLFSAHPEIQVKCTNWHNRWAKKENIWPALRCKLHDLVPKFSHLAWCNSVSFNLHWGAVYVVLCPFYGSLGPVWAIAFDLCTKTFPSFSITVCTGIDRSGVIGASNWLIHCLAHCNLV